MARYKHDPKRMRAYPGVGLCMPGAHGGDLTLYTTRSNYILKGQCMAYAESVYKAVKRITKHALGFRRYDFEFKLVRPLNQREWHDLYRAKRPPPQTKGENW